jgi:hypothetical protein
MRQIIYILIITAVFIACENKNSVNVQSNNIEPVRKSKEERRLEREERERARQQLIAEKKEKYKDMTSVNRESGDIRGIWYITNDELKNMKRFLNNNVDYATGYCIEISEDMKKGKIYFLSNKIGFDVKIEKISETKYSMTYMNKNRLFEVVNLSHPLYKNSKDLIWFFEDSHKFNPNEGSDQFHDGMNFYDFCSRISEHECSVGGCLDRVKTMDEIGYIE